MPIIVCLLTAIATQGPIAEFGATPASHAVVVGSVERPGVFAFNGPREMQSLLLEAGPTARSESIRRLREGVTSRVELSDEAIRDGDVYFVDPVYPGPGVPVVLLPANGRPVLTQLSSDFATYERLAEVLGLRGPESLVTTSGPPTRSAGAIRAAAVIRTPALDDTLLSRLAERHPLTASLSTAVVATPMTSPRNSLAQTAVNVAPGAPAGMPQPGIKAAVMQAAVMQAADLGRAVPMPASPRPMITAQTVSAPAASFSLPPGLPDASDTRFESVPPPLTPLTDLSAPSAAGDSPRPVRSASNAAISLPATSSAESIDAPAAGPQLRAATEPIPATLPSYSVDIAQSGVPANPVSNDAPFDSTATPTSGSDVKSVSDDGFDAFAALAAESMTAADDLEGGLTTTEIAGLAFAALLLLSGVGLLSGSWLRGAAASTASAPPLAADTAAPGHSEPDALYPATVPLIPMDAADVTPSPATDARGPAIEPVAPPAPAVPSVLPFPAATSDAVEELPPSVDPLTTPDPEPSPEPLVATLPSGRPIRHFTDEDLAELPREKSPHVAAAGPSRGSDPVDILRMPAVDASRPVVHPPVVHGVPIGGKRLRIDSAHDAPSGPHFGRRGPATESTPESPEDDVLARALAIMKREGRQQRRAA